MRILAVGVALLAVACSDDLLFVGDSLVAGQTGGNPEPPTPGFVDLVATALPDRTIVNAGCPLSTTVTWTFRRGDEPHLGLPCVLPPGAWEQLVEPFFPTRVAFVMLGTNDSDFRGSCLLWSPCDENLVQPNDYEANLRTLVDDLLDDPRAGAFEVVLVQPPEKDFPPEATVNVVIREYGRRMERICAETPFVRCGPDLKEVIGPEHYAPDDPVHWNSAGHAAVGAALMTYIEEQRL